MQSKIFFSVHKSQDFIDLVDEIRGESVWSFFDERSVNFVNDFSNKLLKHPDIKEYPDLVALAYWFRKARIKKLKENFKNDKTYERLGRGLAFHVAPSNVDTIFIYSFFISLLSGNYNFIRISNDTSPQIIIILEILNEMAKKDTWGCCKRFVICNYDYDKEITNFLSKNCDLRLIWGGDDTVNDISSFSLKPTATEIKFPDRSSFSVINIDVFANIDEEALEQLSSSFLKDILLFGQQACSSPKAVFFIGSQAKEEYITRFWKSVNNKITENLGISQNMNRYVSASSMAIEQSVKIKKSNFDTKEIVVLEGNLGSDKSFREDHFGEGMIIQYKLEAIEELTKHIKDKDQTISIFGFKREDILKLILNIPNRGIDRIVPIGSSLEFDHIWDGNNLFDLMSRKISLPSMN
jgi:hypothetical protein